MNKILKIGFLLMLIGVCVPAFGQITIKSFVHLSNDLDASTFFPKKDFNNRTSAIIKVFTTHQNFSFDNGSLGIVEVVQKPAEIWVYVPENTIKLKITHQKLGHITNGEEDGYYWFPNRVKGGQVYKMELSTGAVIDEPIQTGWIVFNSVPDAVDVYMSPESGGEEKHVGTTPFNKKMPYGNYHYRAKKYNYRDVMGLIKLESNRATVDINLVPSFGSISVNSTPSGAAVYLNGKDTGKKTPCVIDEVSSGKCEVRLQIADYAPATKTIEVQDGKRSEVNLSLRASFAPVTINSIEGAVIKLNGVNVGTSNYTENLQEGFYDIEVSLPNHETAKKQIEVVANEPQTLDLKPTPIYGSIDVNTTPMGANITINGKSYGDTPATINNLLIGDYEVVLNKAGYPSITKHVTVTKGTAAMVDVKFDTGRMVTISTNSKGDRVFVDGMEVGTSPCTVELAYGNHEIKVDRSGATSTKKIAVAQGVGNIDVQLNIDSKKVVKAPKEKEPKKNQSNDKFFRIGAEAGFMYGSLNTFGKTSFGIGAMARLGRVESLININLGLKYQHSSVSNDISYSFLDYESYNHFSGDAKYKNSANELLIPVILNFNLKKVYVGVGYEQGISLGQNEVYDPSSNFDEFIYSVSPDYKETPKLPASSLVMQAGFLHKHLDVKLIYKYDLTNSKYGAMNIGVGFGYYF